MLPPATAPARGAAASRRRPLGARRSASQSCGLAGAGRLRSASATAGADSSAFRMFAVAVGPRQPDVAGAERVPQVEQHRRLPEGGDQGQLREQGQKVLAS